jgi:chromosome partitioning protein
VRVQEKAFRRPIPAAVLFNRTSAAIRPRTLQNIETQFAQSDVPVFRTHLHERDAYKALFVFGGALSGLDPGEVRNVPVAITNARAFAQEVLAMLKAPTKASRIAEVA